MGVRKLCLTQTTHTCVCALVCVCVGTIWLPQQCSLRHLMGSPGSRRVLFGHRSPVHARSPPVPEAAGGDAARAKEVRRCSHRDLNWLSSVHTCGKTHR